MGLAWCGSCLEAIRCVGIKNLSERTTSAPPIHLAVTHRGSDSLVIRA